MMRLTGLFALCLGVSWTFGADDQGVPATKHAFTKGFPQFLAFRGEYVRSSHKDYASWCESEGLVQHNDGFRGFSRTVNTHLYWQQNNTRKHDLRYVVLKLMNPPDAKRGAQLRRFSTGTACCLGALVTDTGDPSLPDAFAKPGSLGFPKGALVRPARSAPDLLKGKGTTAGVLEPISEHAL